MGIPHILLAVDPLPSNKNSSSSWLPVCFRTAMRTNFKNVPVWIFNTSLAMILS